MTTEHEARNIWHGLSYAQRRALERIADGQWHHKPARTAATLDVLKRHDLIETRFSGSWDPDARITDTGRLVLQHR